MLFWILIEKCWSLFSTFSLSSCFYNGCAAVRTVLSRIWLSATPQTVARQAPPSLGVLQARVLEWVAMPSSRGSSQPRDRTRSPALQVDSLLSEPAEKPENTGVGSLTLLWGSFSAQESNQSLLHCRILSQLSYQGTPYNGHLFSI